MDCKICLNSQQKLNLQLKKDLKMIPYQIQKREIHKKNHQLKSKIIIRENLFF